MSSPTSDEPTPSEVRLILRVVGSVVLLAIAAGVATLVSRTDQEARAGDSTVAADRTIGPLPGAPLASYAARQRAVLADVDGRRSAVVWFTRYRSEPEAREVLGGLRVRALFVAAPGGGGRAVDGPLAEWVEAERRAAREERAALEGMLDTQDPAFAAQFRADIARLDALLDALDDDHDVVFAAAVEADAADLRRLAGAPAVRLVDVGPRSLPPLDDLRAARPEETIRAGVPSERPVS